MKSIFIILYTLLITGLVTAQENQKPLLLAHFMPWNVAPPVSSTWGWHWTMNHYNPNNVDANGKREIASHYYPLTGPYDSMDPDILEYQVLLMKLSGIDGIIVDWYGTGNLWDYPGINDRTNAMFEYIEKAGLKFSICYEDQTLPNLISQNIIFEDEKYDQGKRDIKYVQDTWFGSDAHVKLDGAPVLFNFGPQYFKQSAEWEDIFSALSTPPLFFTEDNRIAPAAVGAFSWPPMWKSANGVLTQAALVDYLNQFSTKSAGWPYRVSSAFPGFNDIYKEAGVSAGYGVLDARNGVTFELTLNKALSDNPHIIQLVTWNDYGEGTIIEPTEEFGYRYLEIVQDFRREHIDATFPMQHGHLRLPLQIFELRKNRPSDAAMNATLDQVFELFIDMKLTEAETLLETITEVTDPGQPPRVFVLAQNYPNPFNPETIIEFFLPEAAQVRLTIYSSAGQRVATLANGLLSAGQHAVVWEAGELPSGIYFYRLETGEVLLTRKCLLVR